MTDPTIHDSLDAALEAYDRLGLLGEDIEDEWTYVTDLTAAWRDRLEAVDQARGDEAAGAAGPAIDRAIDEIDRMRPSGGEAAPQHAVARVPHDECAGDVVEVHVPQLGTLRNPIITEPR